MLNEKKTARLLVSERKGRWAAALRRELSETGVRVWETGTYADCGTQLAQSTASFLVLELNETKIRELLHYILAWQQEFPAFRFAVVSDHALQDYHWFMREIGAADFVSRQAKIGALAETICRHLALAPRLSQSLTERIWTNLPWGSYY
ncbi:MAG: hypothetical protein ACWGMZ_08990 [Thermoguttaceae bacterium]